MLVVNKVDDEVDERRKRPKRRQTGFWNGLSCRTSAGSHTAEPHAVPKTQGGSMDSGRHRHVLPEHGNARHRMNLHNYADIFDV